MVIFIHVDNPSFLQVTGEAMFVDDAPPVPGQLYASLVLSKVGNATIQSIDQRPALVRH